MPRKAKYAGSNPAFRSNMKNHILDYIEKEIKEFPIYVFDRYQKRLIEKQGIADFIKRRLFSHQFRKAKLSKETYDFITTKIINKVRESKPIRLAIPIGGYKKWQFNTSPNVDWAEFFHLRFMFRMLAPILQVYKPGISLEYFSNDWMVKIIDYYPQADLDSYADSFRTLIKLFEPSFPKNFKISYDRVGQQKDPEVLLSRVLKNRQKIESEWKNLSEKEKNGRLDKSSRNIRFDILEKNKPLSKTEKERIIFEGKILHDCLIAGGWNSDLDYLRNDDKIPVIHIYRKSDVGFLYLASCSGSLIQFWSGTGIIQVKNKDKITPGILSFAQFDKIRNQLEFIKVSNPSSLKNLLAVPVICNSSLSGKEYTKKSEFR